ncbi:50S ribosomal protein L23 [Candidatus Saccharibacteria bacterium]|nr:MAG: 50S ribosomal protein L23 [Candidatus Saccharibacteria bacterium]
MTVLKPRLSEKAFATSQFSNTFVIDVPAELNKHEVAAAVEKQFEVKVKTVRTVSRKGKSKRTMNITGKRMSNRRGTQSDIKKAYITLVAGHHLPFFEAEEKEVAEAAKAAEKDSKKDDKKAETSEKKGVASKLGLKKAKKEETK